MKNKWILAIAVVLAGSSTLQAQGPAGKFHWKPGQVLTYKVEQITKASEQIDGKTVETASKVYNTKKWQVMSVEGAFATLQLSLTALRVETKVPGGEIIRFDSADPEKSDPQMREQLTKYVGQPLAVLRVNEQGKVIEVKESKHGPGSRFESEPPFVITLTGNTLNTGQTWERAYNITLDPPHGTGEKFAAVQNYQCHEIKDGKATVSLATSVKTLPESMLDQVPLLQLQPQGQAIFDLNLGCLRKANLRIDKELKGHQGEGSHYRFQSTYHEELVEAK